jgi:hypothetical protein
MGVGRTPSAGWGAIGSSWRRAKNPTPAPARSTTRRRPALGYRSATGRRSGSGGPTSTWRRSRTDRPRSLSHRNEHLVEGVPTNAAFVMSTAETKAPDVAVPLLEWNRDLPLAGGDLTAALEGALTALFGSGSARPLTTALDYGYKLVTATEDEPDAGSPLSSQSISTRADGWTPPPSPPGLEWPPKIGRANDDRRRVGGLADSFLDARAIEPAASGARTPRRPARRIGGALGHRSRTIRSLSTWSGRSPKGYFRAARISPQARSPDSTPPLRYPWKSIEVCSPAKWQLPSGCLSAPANFVY